MAESFIEFTTGLEEEELPEINKMPEDWDTYVTLLDDEKALIMVDLEVAKIAPVLAYKHLLGIQFAFKNPTEDGFYTAEEQERLFEIEDRVAQVYRDEAHAKHVASITTGGARMMYFYADDDTYLAGLVGKMASEFGDYEFNYLLEKDAPWNFYFNVVYPSLLDMQIMKNRRMIRLMAENGEDLNQVREVTHWFFFNNGASRKQASVRLRDGGCEILDDNFFDERVPEYNFGMRVLIKHNMTQEKMLEVTYALYDFIERYDGIYDGWNIIPDGDPEKAFV
ncbi:MAG: DUF695 domain-containing protein [Peptococcaceae bacterium]|nr:DUF695 domain-containing protein [Peptococcaceae bacterium]MBQ2995279.1 DUF695 domain-containing protein [Peptococcaceae bacterium]